VVTGVAPKELKGLVDAAKASLGSGVAAFVAVSEDGKASVVVGVTEDLTSKLSAVDLVRAASEAIGGKGGGGRPDMAQAGGPDGAKANAAIDAVLALDQMIRSNARDQPGRFAFAVTIGRHRHPQLSKICAVGMCC
jgi:alanyl-tRNA synthetase